MVGWTIPCHPPSFSGMNEGRDPRILRAREAFDRRDYVAALTELRDLAEESPNFADVRHLMGLCLSMLGQPEDALEEFNAALGVNGEYIEAHLNRAITLNELGRYEEARDSFASAVACEERVGGRFPASVSARLANAHATVGELYLTASAPSEASREFQKALELRPTFHDIRNRLAESYMQLGDLDRAQDELERVLAGNGRFLQARLNLGLIHYRRGRRDDAREQWEECRSQEPNSPQVRAYLQLLESGVPGTAGQAG